MRHYDKVHLAHTSNMILYSLRGMYIMFIRVGATLEREGSDRADINLPGQQLQLLKDAAETTSGSD